MRVHFLLLLLLAAAAVARPAAADQARPLPLAEALDLAARQNPSLQLAKLQELETALSVDRARSAYLPQAAFSAGSAYRTTNLQGIGLVFPGLSSRIGPFGVFDARPTVTQTILDASLLSRIRAARERARQAGEEQAGVREALLYAVVQSYLQALEAGARIEAAASRQATAEAVLRQTRDRQQAGAASQLDIERAARLVHEETAALERARGERAVIKTMLARLIAADDPAARGAELFELVAIAPPRQQPDFDAALGRGRRERPELRALEARLAAETHDVEAARRERLPKIAGSADWGVLGASPAQSIGTYNLAASVTVPLWTGRRIESEISAAALRKRQTEARIRDLQLTIAQEVRQAEAEAEATRRELDAVARAAGAARETLSLVRLRYEAGLATSLDVTVAQGGLAQAEETEIAARYRHLAAFARLAHAQGSVASFLEL